MAPIMTLPSSENYFPFPLANNSPLSLSRFEHSSIPPNKILYPLFIKRRKKNMWRPDHQPFSFFCGGNGMFNMWVKAGHLCRVFLCHIKGL